MITKKKPIEKTKEEPKEEFLPVDLINSVSMGRTSTCCGTLELGNFSTRRESFGIQVFSKRNVKNPHKTYDWDPDTIPAVKRPTTYEEISEAFHKAQADVWPKTFGQGVAYLRPEQQDGVYGRLFKELGWTDLGHFWNPNTRRTLHMWTKNFHKEAPKPKAASKSILSKEG